MSKANAVIRILLVDDDEGDTELAGFVFKDLHLQDQVLVLDDGIQAMDYLLERESFQGRAPGLPALILLDIKMPGLDGLQVLSQIRADAALRRLPVVMLTGSRQESDLHQAYDLGVNGYLVKAFDYAVYQTHLAACVTFFVLANETPPGTLPRPSDGTDM
jgi:two-component system response regulator